MLPGNYSLENEDEGEHSPFGRLRGKHRSVSGGKGRRGSTLGGMTKRLTYRPRQRDLVRAGTGEHRRALLRGGGDRVKPVGTESASLQSEQLSRENYKP